jgi:hypothetical protein
MTYYLRIFYNILSHIFISTNNLYGLTNHVFILKKKILNVIENTSC